MKDHLVVGTNLSVAKSAATSISEFKSSGMYDADYGVMSNAIRLDPVTPAQNPDGTYGYSPYIDYYNPLASVMYGNRNTDKLAVIGNMYGEWQIIKGLKFKSSFGVEFRRVDSKSFSPVYQVSNSQKKLGKQSVEKHINGSIIRLKIHCRTIGNLVTNILSLPLSVTRTNGEKERPWE